MTTFYDQRNLGILLVCGTAWIWAGSTIYSSAKIILQARQTHIKLEQIKPLKDLLPVVYETNNESTPPPVVIQKPVRSTYTMSIRYMAATMIGEARDQGLRGERAVGQVIINRVAANKDRFGHNIVDVILHHKQFSCWNKKDPNRKLLDALIKADSNHKSREYLNLSQTTTWSEYQAAKSLSAFLIYNHPRDITGGATFYYAPSAMSKRFSKPNWIHDHGMKMVGQLGAHIFYSLFS